MNRALPPVDLADAAGQRAAQLRRLAGQLVRDAIRIAGDREDAATALAAAMTVALNAALDPDGEPPEPLVRCLITGAELATTAPDQRNRP